jgi:2-polyprenyl-6-hydroxyphenyl methylase/3-demethylubiquinone-9 3-methyltransferase
VSEPLARLGASVTGIDPAPENIEAAKAHAEGARVKVDYRAATAEEIAAKGVSFDAVLLLEVVEHVPDVPAFLKLVARLVKPGGVMVLSTLNRTLKAYALAIIGAEFILRWLPLGTHNWDRFVRPDELKAALEHAGLTLTDTTGMVYNPLADEWSLSRDTDVNYFATAIRASWCRSNSRSDSRADNPEVQHSPAAHNRAGTNVRTGRDGGAAAPAGHNNCRRG